MMSCCIDCGNEGCEQQDRPISVGPPGFRVSVLVPCNVCPGCGLTTISSENLGRAERHAALRSLTVVSDLTGEIVSYARKTLDMSPAELSEWMQRLETDESSSEKPWEWARDPLVRMLRARGARS